jgi:hypothetical protein
MPDELHLIEQKKRIRAYLDDKFNINSDKLIGSDMYLDHLLQCIVSHKIWQKHLTSTIPPAPMNYLNEIISNHNQMLIMGIIGFKVPSYIMVRRSLENLLGFLYYKDHPIELIKKEYEIGLKKPPVKFGELQDYIKEYPFDSFYDRYDCKIMAQLLNQLMISWKEQYRDLSNFVHGTNSKYMELNAYMDDIYADKETFQLLGENVEKFRTISNTLLLVFFFDNYKKFIPVEKVIITSAISEGLGYKQKIQDIFGEI